MDPKLLEEFKRNLLELRERLSTEVQSGEQAIVDAAQAPEGSHLPTHAADFDSGAVESNVATTQQQTKILQAVDAALERVHAGTYGDCVQCGRVIAPLRLEAIPYTSFCFECANRLEGE
jgi:RNA polymerase-binding transcription factor DksA